jgi:hypothetical protein
MLLASELSDMIIAGNPVFIIKRQAKSAQMALVFFTSPFEDAAPRPQVLSFLSQPLVAPAIF